MLRRALLVAASGSLASSLAGCLDSSIGPSGDDSESNGSVDDETTDDSPPEDEASVIDAPTDEIVPGLDELNSDRLDVPNVEDDEWGMLTDRPDGDPYADEEQRQTTFPDGGGEHHFRALRAGSDIVAIDVWMHGSIEDAQVHYEESREFVLQTDSIETTDVGSEGFVYKPQEAYVLFRHANVVSRVRHLTIEHDAFGSLQTVTGLAESMIEWWES